jgi:outer membrane protein
LQQADAREELSLKRRALQQMTGRPFAALPLPPPGTALPTLAEGEDTWVEQAKSRGYGVQSKQPGWQIARFDS